MEYELKIITPLLGSSLIIITQQNLLLSKMSIEHFKFSKILYKIELAEEINSV